MLQGSEEWLKYRRRMVMASDAPIIMGVSPYCTPKKLWERKLGLIPEQETNSNMQRGKDLEEVVRKLLEERGLYFLPAVLTSADYPWMGASLDGYSFNREICEIKCINRKDHELSTFGKVPKQYVPQLQHQMYVCNVDKVLYVSYFPKHHEEDLVMFHVERDDNYIEKLLDKEKMFYDCMCSKIWNEEF